MRSDITMSTAPLAMDEYLACTIFLIPYVKDSKKKMGLCG